MTTGGGAAGEGGRLRAEALHLAVAASVATLLAAFHRALPQLHALNFSTAGPGPTAALAAILVTGWTLPLAAGRDGPLGAGPAPGLAAAGGLALALSLAPNAVVAVAAGLAAFPLLTPGLAALTEELGPRVGVGFAAGVLLHQALRAATGAAPLAATGPGRVLLLALAAGTVAAWAGLARRGWAPALPARGLRADAAPLMVALLAEAAFLASPDAPAAWLGAPRLPAALASAAGLAAGAGLVAAGPEPGPRWAVAAAGVLVLAALDATHGLWLGALAVLPAQGALIVLVAHGGRPGPERSATAAGARVLAAQAVAVLLLVGVVWAGNWSFVPGGGLVRGAAPALLAALLAWPAAALLRRGPLRRWAG